MADRFPQVAAIGTHAEIAHHVRPLERWLPVQIWEPDTARRELRAGDVAIFYSEHFDRFRECCLELKTRGVATLYLIDGILEWRNAWENQSTEPACPWTMRNCLAHKVACIGPSQKRVLDFWGNHGKTEIVGIPRLEPMRLAFGEGIAAVPFPAPPWQILVATAKTPGFTPEQWNTTRRSLAELRDFFLAHPTLHGHPVVVTWRIHPKIAAELHLSTSWNELSGGEVADQIRRSHAVITTPSTMGLESMLLHRPTAWLDFHAAPCYVPAAWHLTHSQTFSQLIPELLQPPAAKLDFQRASLQDSLTISEDASRRLSELVQAMLRIAGSSAAKQELPEFPETLLPPLECEPVRRQTLARLFPDYAPLGWESHEQLAAEFVHSRREIGHLQRQLEQARTELAEAHRIFQQIQDHPIAGPIVRFRQRCLDFWRAKSKQDPSESPEQTAESSKSPSNPA